MSPVKAAIFVGGVVIALAMVWFWRRPEPVAVLVQPVALGEVIASVSNTRAGTVDACNRAKLAPVIGGQIAALPVAEGDQVAAGTVLMELWNADIRAQLALAEHEYEVAKARSEEACATARVAERESQRLGRLHRQGLGSEEQADLAAGEATARQAACDAANELIKVQQSAIEVASAAVERTIIRAPFDGTVAEINGEIGEVVTPSPVGIATPPAVDLVDNTCLFVTAPIDEVDAPQIRAGMTARITLDAFAGQQFPATVRRIAPYVQDREKQARTVDVEAEFDEPCDDLLPGYSADIEIVLDERHETLRVPRQALLTDGRVLVLEDDNILRERAIEVGLKNWRYAEILDGLQADELVVVSTDREGVVAGAVAVIDE